MGIAGGVKNLPWLFTATFLTLIVAQPFYGALVARLHASAFHPHRLSLLCRQPRAVLAVADAPCRHRHRRARVLCLGQPCSACSRSRCSGRSWPTFSPPIRASACSASSAQAARPAHCSARLSRSAFGAARSGQSPDRRDDLAGSGGVLRLAAGTCGNATQADQQAEPPRLGGSAFAALPELIRSPYLLGIAAWISLQSFCATILYFQQINLRRRRRARRRCADADFRRHRSRGKSAVTGDAGFCHRTTAQAFRHRHHGRGAAGDLYRGLPGGVSWCRR